MSSTPSASSAGSHQTCTCTSSSWATNNSPEPSCRIPSTTVLGAWTVPCMIWSASASAFNRRDTTSDASRARNSVANKSDPCGVWCQCKGTTPMRSRTKVNRFSRPDHHARAKAPWSWASADSRPQQRSAAKTTSALSSVSNRCNPSASNARRTSWALSTWPCTTRASSAQT